MKLLIVDDDFVCRKLLKAILEPHNLCDVVISGDEAVLAFKVAIKEKAPYDGIFLDIMMPGSDGYGVLKEIREIERRRKTSLAKSVKIIMATSVDEPEMVMKAFKDQCDGYMVKPIIPEQVLDVAAKAGLSLNT